MAIAILHFDGDVLGDVLCVLNHVLCIDLPLNHTANQLSFAGITMKVSLGRPSQDVLVCGLDSCVMNLVVSVLHLAMASLSVIVTVVNVIVACRIVMIALIVAVLAVIVLKMLWIVVDWTVVML